MNIMMRGGHHQRDKSKQLQPKQHKSHPQQPHPHPHVHHHNEPDWPPHQF